MTENESIKELEASIDLAKMCTQNYERKREIQGYEMAIKALEEVQHWHTSVINPKIKNVFANSSTQICHNCDHKDEYIEELEAEVEEYRTIGTPEVCLQNKDFLDFISDKMNPNDFETYLRLYNALEEKE